MGDFGDYFHQKIPHCSRARQIILLLSADNKDKKYYNEGNISPSMAIVLSNCFITVCTHLLKLVLQRKGYELSLYFNRTEDPNAEQCPFLIDEDNVIKIKEQKKLLLQIWLNQVCKS
jgi:hypothetical protein